MGWWTEDGGIVFCALNLHFMATRGWMVDSVFPSKSNHDVQIALFTRTWQRHVRPHLTPYSWMPAWPCNRLEQHISRVTGLLLPFTVGAVPVCSWSSECLGPMQFEFQILNMPNGMSLCMLMKLAVILSSGGACLLVVSNNNNKPKLLHVHGKL